MKQKNNKVFWILLSLCVITLFTFLGLFEYNTKGEPRESIVAVSMLDSGNWILPRNNGGEMAYKPPFFHWCVAVFSFLWGSVTEASSRIPSAIALTCMIMAGFIFFRKRANETIAFLTALISLTCMELHRAGGNCRVDMVLTALTVTALYALYRWYEKGMKQIPWIAIPLMSCATMTKGPVGTIIPCLAVGVFLLIRKVNFWRAFLSLVGIGLATFIIPALWYYAAWCQGGQEFIDLMYEENIGRMTSTMAYESCVNPWPYNILTLIIGFLPFTLLLLMSTASLQESTLTIPTLNKNINLWQNIKNKSVILWQKILSLNSIDLFAMVCAITIFVFYCIPQSKRSVYLMPMYPFVAYFIARYMLWLANMKKKVIIIYGWIICSIILLLIIATIILQLHIIPETIFHGRHALDNIMILRGLSSLTSIGEWVCVIIAFASAIWWIVYTRNNKEITSRHVFLTLAMLVGVYIGVDGAWKPAALNAKSQKPVAQLIDKLCPESEGNLYEYIDEGVKSLGDPVHYFELNFYLQHKNRIKSFHKEKPQHGFLLIGNKDFELCKQEFEAEGYRFQILHETERRVCGQNLNIIKF